MVMKKSALALACAMGLASQAHAAEHTIVLTGFSYFPAVTYVSPGDTVIFVNSSGEEQTVVGKDAGWTVGPLQNDEEGALSVTQETELRFYAAHQEDVEGEAVDDEETAESEYGSYETAPIKAEITFDEPPLNG